MIKSRNKYLAVSTTYKEDPWNIMEWLEYHILVGVDHFFIYNNDELAKIGNLIFKPYVDSGYVTHIHSFNSFNNTNNKQRACHNNALMRSKGRFRWLAMLDSDEFIYPVSCNNLKISLKNYEDIPALCLNYCCFGSNGLNLRPSMQIESYIRRSQDFWEWNKLTKSIGQVELVGHCDHHHKFAGPLYDENKQRCKWVKPYKGKILKIIHYMARSKEDYQIKMRRGNPLGEKRDWRWFNWADRNEILDKGIKDRFGSLVRKNLELKKSFWEKSKLKIKI